MKANYLLLVLLALLGSAVLLGPSPADSIWDRREPRSAWRAQEMHAGPIIQEGMLLRAIAVRPDVADHLAGVVDPIGDPGVAGSA